jgi:hypothetical protein
MKKFRALRGLDPATALFRSTDTLTPFSNSFSASIRQRIHYSAHPFFGAALDAAAAIDVTTDGMVLSPLFRERPFTGELK